MGWGVGGGGEEREKTGEKKLGTTPVTCINIALKNKKNKKAVSKCMKPAAGNINCMFSEFPCQPA